MPAGWYDDPWNSGALRWWDGAQWTPHTSYTSVTPVQYGSYARQVTTGDLDGVARVGRFASIALGIGAVMYIVQFVLDATLLHSVVHQIGDEFRRFNDQLNADPNSNPQLHLHIGKLLLLDLTTLPILGVEIMTIVWLYQAAGIAERIPLARSLSRVWAILGFIVPIVNFWFPYVVARDLLPSDDRSRQLALYWWLLYLAQGVLSIAIVITSFVSYTAAVVLAVPSCAVPILCAVNGRRMIAAVTQRHRELAGHGAATTV